MSTFNRDLVPGWESYADAEGLTLQGRGKWRTTRCDIHSGSDSLRVNTESGGWRCMACHAKGGDTLSHYMQLTGMSFAAAARMFGCIDDNGQPLQPQRRFSARDALEVVGLELGICVLIISDARRGITPTDSDWTRFLEAAGCVQTIADEVRQ